MRKRILSIWLSVCMVLTMLPISAMAKEAGTPIGEIIAFAPLAETEKSVTTGTSIEDLELPESLTATVRTAVTADSGTKEEAVQDSGNPDNLTEATPGSATPTDSGEQAKADEVTEPEWNVTTSDIPVTWTSEYDMDTEGVYVFTPMIEGYMVSAELPEITVTVGAQPLMMALRGGAPADYGDFSVSLDEDGVAPTFNSGVLTFTAAGEYTIGMADDKTSTSHRIVVSASGVTLNLNGVTIEAPAASSAEINGANALTVTSGTVTLNVTANSSLTGGIGFSDPMISGTGGAGISGDVEVTGAATLTAAGGIGGSAALGICGTGGAGISGNATITGAAALTATGGMGGASGMGISGTGGAGISGNVAATDSASLIAIGGQCGGDAAYGGNGISGDLTVTGSATVSATGGDASVYASPGRALTGTLTATGFIIKGGHTGLTNVITSSDSRLNQFRYISVEPAPSVAEIGSTGYSTLQGAVDAVTAGQTIKLLDDITITDSSSITISSVNSFTLDLNGKTLDGGSGSASLIKHNGSGTLTIVDSGTGGKMTSSRPVGNNGGTVELSSGNGALTLLSGTIENTSTNGSGIYNNGTGTVSIQDGAVKANECGVNNKSGNVSVSGGVVSANKNLAAAILSSAGKVTLSGGSIYNPTYVGVALSNSSLVVSGGAPVIQGGAAAMNAAPTVDSDTIEKVIASTSYDGSNPVANYNASHITSYKYLTFVVKVTPTAAEYAAASPAAAPGTDYVLDDTVTPHTLTIKTPKGAAYWSANGASYLDYTVLLAADINVSDFLWTPVGSGSGSGAAFSGSFDGQGHSISGLTITAANESYAGLFGGASGAAIQNLCVSGTIEVTELNELYIGGISGCLNNNSTIRNCCSHVDIRGAANEVNAGGIVGWLESGTIENCFNTGDVSGTGTAAMIAGGIYGAISSYGGNSGIVKNSYNTGSLTGSGSSITWLGALGGNVGSNIVMENCHYLSGTASAAFGYGSSANSSSFTADEADDLLAALNGWVAATASTSYYTWQADSATPVNGGYPVFGAAWTSPVASPTFDFCNGAATASVKPTEPTWAGTGYTFAGWYTMPNGEGTELTGDGDSGTTYYAKWTINGKTVRTTALDLTNIGASKLYGSTKSGDAYTNTDEGWIWYAVQTTVGSETYAANTLVLSGLTLNTTAPTALKVPSSATIVLGDGTTSTIQGGDVTAGAVYGIYGAGALTVSGGGTLSVTAGDSGRDMDDLSAGIFSSGALTVNGGTVTSISGQAAQSCGMMSNGTLAIDGDAVTGVGGLSVFGAGIFSLDDLTITGGTVAGSGDGVFVGYGISATGKIAIVGGTVTGNGGGLMGCGIFAEEIAITDGTVIATNNAIDEDGNPLSAATAIEATTTLTIGSTAKPATITNATDGTSAITASSSTVVSKKLVMSSSDAVVISFATYYAITENTATNGSFTVKVNGSAVTAAQSNETVTVIPTANSGYELDTITVCKTGDSSTTVTVTNSNTFTMPAYAVTVNVTFKVSSVPVYTISGTIKGSDTSSGIPASLQLKDGGGNVLGTTTAAANGSYSFTSVSAGNYTISVSYTGYDSGTITGVTVSNANITGQNLTLTKSISGLTDAQKLAAAKAAIMAAINQMSFSNSTTAADILSVAQATSLYGVTVTWDSTDGFTKMQATTSAKGSIRGTLKLELNHESGGIGIDATIAKLSTGGDNGGGGSNGGGSTTPPSTKPTEPVTGSTENKATVDGKGNASVSLTDKNITDAIADAKAEAVKKGVNAGDITAVIHVTTGGKDANTVTVNLPKTTQEQVIGNKIASVQLVIDRPDLIIGINLAAVSEINRQANADVQITATRTDASTLGEAARNAIGSRPAYDLAALYQNGGHRVTDFGSGSVTVEIPYILQAGEKGENIRAVYVDERGAVTYLSNAYYDTARQSLIFSTPHFSVYGVGYKADDTPVQSEPQPEPQPEPVNPKETRLSGETCYDTAAAIAKAYFGSGTELVILARGDISADALPAVPLAKLYNAPLLLTEQDQLPLSILNTIKVLGAKKVIIIGGPGAVKDGVETTLKMNGLAVERIYGETHYDTAYEVAKRIGGASGQAVIVNGNMYEKTFADALSISAWAGYNGIPILYGDSSKDSLPAGTAKALAELGIRRTILIGGTAVLPAVLEGKVPDPKRYGGETLYDTNIMVLRELQSGGTEVYAATGKGFADALAGAAVAAQRNGWLVLTGASSGTGLTTEQERWLSGAKERVNAFHVFGGEVVVPQSTADSIRTLLGR